jgi:hypothetical protein
MLKKKLKRQEGINFKENVLSKNEKKKDIR